MSLQTKLLRWGVAVEGPWKPCDSAGAGAEQRGNAKDEERKF